MQEVRVAYKKLKRGTVDTLKANTQPFLLTSYCLALLRSARDRPALTGAQLWKMILTEPGALSLTSGQASASPRL